MAGRTYWLVQSYFSNGASSRYWLHLLHGEKGGPSKLVDLTSRLKYRVGTKPSGLDENEELETTTDWAQRMGFGGWPSSIDNIVIASDRYLIASGLWTSNDLRWMLVFDLRSDEILLFNRDIPEGASAAEFGVTEGGRTLIQSNFTGQLFFHDVKSGRIVLRGQEIDDELIFYDDHGYYSTSPEGGQLMFLKFPGVPGYNSLKQFARTLNRPDLIEAILSGNHDTPDPRLTPPPTVSMTAEVAGIGAARSARLRLDAASPVGLEKLLVFIDGGLNAEHAVTGPSARVDIVVPLSPEARWMTTVAVDKTGYESVPRGQALPGASNGHNRLFAIAVGTDVYEDRANIIELKSTKADATNFLKAVSALQGGLYGSVEVTSFLDAPDLRNTLPAKISRNIQKSWPRRHDHAVCRRARISR